MPILSNKWSRYVKNFGGRSRTKSGRRFPLEPLESRVVLSVPASVVSPSTLYGASAVMTLQNFDGPTVPLDKAGDTYPSIYTGEGSAGTVNINTADAVEGNSVQANVTTKGLYLQFNPYDTSTRGFARDYSAAPAAWQFNTYNRLSFWIKRPTTASPLITNGSHGTYVGTYLKQVANPDPYSDETGGGHAYHSINLPNNGQWTQVILNMHPDHYRGDSGGVDLGDQPHPTGESQYNYFDALTRFYIDDTTDPDHRHLSDRRHPVLPGAVRGGRRPGRLADRHL